MPASPELLLFSIPRALAEVAGFALVGQGALALIAGKSREGNFAYRLLRTITHPALRLARWITPRLILDRYLPFVAFFLLFWLWIGLALAKRAYCAAHGLACI